MIFSKWQINRNANISHFSRANKIIYARLEPVSLSYADSSRNALIVFEFFKILTSWRSVSHRFVWFCPLRWYILLLWIGKKAINQRVCFRITKDWNANYLIWLCFFRGVIGDDSERTDFSSMYFENDAHSNVNEIIGSLLVFFYTRISRWFWLLLNNHIWTWNDRVRRIDTFEYSIEQRTTLCKLWQSRQTRHHRQNQTALVSFTSDQCCFTDTVTTLELLLFFFLLLPFLCVKYNLILRFCHKTKNSLQ